MDNGLWTIDKIVAKNNQNPFIFAASMFAHTHTQPTLRFRGWSRKSYAAFHSVGRHITIGSLKSVVADTFLGKQQNIFSFSLAMDEKQGQATEEGPEPPDERPLLPAAILPVFPVRIKYKKVYVQYLYFIYPWLMAVTAFSHFYFNRSKTGTI